MTRLRWAKFWWDDWLVDPGLRLCTPAERGVWIDYLCLMARADPPGRLLINGLPPSCADLARVLRVSWRTLDQITKRLVDLHVCSVEDGVIVCRRMIKEWEFSQAQQGHGRKRWASNGGGEPSGSPSGFVRSEAESVRSQSKRLDAEAESPPAPPRGGRAARDRNGFNGEARDMMEDHADADTTNARPGGARVVDLAGRLVRG